MITTIWMQAHTKQNTALHHGYSFIAWQERQRPLVTLSETALTALSLPIFSCMSLLARWLSEHAEGTKSDRFRFLAEEPSLHLEEAPTEGSDGEIRIKPNLYILVWEPSFYEELLTRLFLPVPTRDPEAAYLGLQNVFLLQKPYGASSSDCMLLSELNQKLARNIDWRRFRWI